ncbi:class IIc cyclic bacteriocin [Bacillus haynesii]|uniref:class IIc cyclic bacteriocin n=1 Tax=Bacillus haynesii TaxID=1925021 RepID=UPI00227DE883|nr:class IIc cyclic bacteriocin [Bacillus haynesii]MCY8005443.1 class IIc cyclic bacteriocin [Bacillus haynesii]
MRTDFLLRHMNLSKFETALLSSLLAGVVLIGLAVNLNLIADYFNIKIAADWYRQLTDWLAAGGSLASFAAVVMGITLPAWLAAAATALGAYAA